jgi:hypothetical protein
MFQKTLDMDFSRRDGLPKVFGIVKNPRGKKLPVILAREEVRKVLNLVRILRHKSISSTMKYTQLTPIISENVHQKVDRLMNELFI